MLDILSTELLEYISFLLDGPDLSSLRLVCRFLCEKTTAVFGRAWLCRLETDLSEKSLRRLKTISDHEIFRNSVCMLRIIRDYTLNGHLGGDCVWPRQVSSALDLSSVLVRNFHDILRLFDNCTTFEVCDRAGSYFDDKAAAPSGLSPYDALHLILSAMVTSASSIQILRVYLERESTYRHAKHLPLITINSALFPSLKELDISLYIGDEVVEQVVYLIKAATRLKRLRLNFGDSAGATGFFHQLFRVPMLPPIANLRIGNMKPLSCIALANVILRFENSLCSLHIGYVSLDNGDWSSFFSNLSRHDFTYLENIAVCIVRGGQPPHYLRKGKVYFCPLRLKEKTLEKCGGIFEFMLLPERKKWRVVGVRYTGPPTGTELALKALADDSYYIVSSHVDRSPSPNLPDMKTFTGDGVGRVVPRFDQVETWEGYNA